MSGASEPVEEPPAVTGVPPETPEAVRPSTTGVLADPAADEDDAAVEAGRQITKDAKADEARRTAD
jgi:hypothetical protein